MSNLTFQQAIDMTRDIIKRWEKVEGRPWGAEGSMIELGKQVGQLSSLVLVQEKYYAPDRAEDDPKYQSSKQQIADELADILFVLVRLADHYGIDLESAHIDALKIADEDLTSKGV